MKKRHKIYHFHAFAPSITPPFLCKLTLRVYVMIVQTSCMAQFSGLRDFFSPANLFPRFFRLDVTYFFKAPVECETSENCL